MLISETKSLPWNPQSKKNQKQQMWKSLEDKNPCELPYENNAQWLKNPQECNNKNQDG